MKRILSLDGGGLRGLFTLQILARVEALFRAEHGRPDLVLRDVFDLFAGSSTGAITATCLAWGMSVETIERLYVEHAGKMFTRAPWYLRWKAAYGAERMSAILRDLFVEDDKDRTPALLGTTRLGVGDELKYLLIVMRNASTGSTWPVTNNPRARFNDRALADCNLNIPVWQLVRASTAAPTFFPPQEIQIGNRRDLFVDAGITPFANPALIAVLMATLPAYGLEWPTGCDKLSLLSVGTGTQRVRFAQTRTEQVHLLDHVAHAAPALIASIAWQQDMLCRLLGECRFGAPLNSEIGDLCGASLLTPSERKVAYVRYDCELPSATPAPGQRCRLDKVAHMPALRELGQRYARDTVRPEHLFPK